MADEDLDAPSAGDAADQLPEVASILEGGEDAPELVALRELWRRHDVEKAVAEDLLDGRRVVLADDLDGAFPDTPRESLDGIDVAE